jgi:hypothetical protein
MLQPTDLWRLAAWMLQPICGVSAKSNILAAELSDSITPIYTPLRSRLYPIRQSGELLFQPILTPVGRARTSRHMLKPIDGSFHAPSTILFLDSREMAALRRRTAPRSRQSIRRRSVHDVLAFIEPCALPLVSRGCMATPALSSVFDALSDVHFHAMTRRFPTVALSLPHGCPVASPRLPCRFPVPTAPPLPATTAAPQRRHSLYTHLHRRYNAKQPVSRVHA